MKYNITTVSNSSYFLFLKVWIDSLYDKINLNNINNIYIIDTGLKSEEKKYLSLFPKVNLLDTEINVQFDTLHGKGWSDSNYAKLPAIKKIIKQDLVPTYFIDVDSVFNIDFTEILDFSSDITVCNTLDRTSYFNSELIGSFYGFNSIDKAEKIIDEWYDLIINSKKISTKFRESPALSIFWKENKEKYKFHSISESIISANLLSPKREKVYIYHMKSEGAYGYRTPEQRIKMPHCIEAVGRYINV